MLVPYLATDRARQCRHLTHCPATKARSIDVWGHGVIASTCRDGGNVDYGVAHTSAGRWASLFRATDRCDLTADTSVWPCRRRFVYALQHVVITSRLIVSTVQNPLPRPRTCSPTRMRCPLQRRWTRRTTSMISMPRRQRDATPELGSRRLTAESTRCWSADLRCHTAGHLTSDICSSLSVDSRMRCRPHPRLPVVISL